MVSLRKLVLVTAGVVALGGAVACVADDSGEPGSGLNPQPLPPKAPGDNGGDDRNGQATGAGAPSSDASGDGGACPDGAAPDAGATDAGCGDQ